MDFRRDLILRWPDPSPSHVPVLKKAGIQAVLLRAADAEFTAACKQAGIETALESSLTEYTVDRLPAADPAAYVALSTGLWPGIARGPARPGSPNDEVASASNEPWIDANGFWVAYLKAMFPKSSPVLAYEANEAAGIKDGRVVGFETLEIAYAEARAAGGNYILSMEKGYREALLKGDPKAVAAWAKLGSTAQWFRENDALFNGSAHSTITALVESGEETAEFANLLFRRNASPALVSAVPEPSPSILALVAVGLRTPPAATAARIFAHAERGATVLLDDPALRTKGMREVKQQEDRVFYALGKGQVIAYKERVINPSELALDVIDAITHARRPVRIWNTLTVIAMAGANGVLHLVNYAAPNGRGRGGNGSEIQVRYQGHFAKARLLQPGAPPKQLETARRGSTTEVWVPAFERIATVVFS
jgi:hypothetical protein